MSRSLPHPPLRPPHIMYMYTLLYDLPIYIYIYIYNRPMRLPVWRFGWGRNTAQERYGTVLHRASTCGDDCWIEHGTQVCPALYVQGIFSIACVIQIHFVCILKRETRQNYIDKWQKMLLRKKYQSSTAPQQPVVLPHHGPNSGLAKTKKASEKELNCHSSSSPFVLLHCTHE